MINENKIEIKIRDAPVKLLDTIENKISRKTEEQTPDKIP